MKDKNLNQEKPLGNGGKPVFEPTTNIRKGTPKVTFIAAGCVILLILSPWIYYIDNFDPNNFNSSNVDLKHHIQEVVDNIKNFIVINATELIKSTQKESVNLNALQNSLNDNLEHTLNSNYRPYFVKEQKIEITVSYGKVELKPMFKTTYDLERYPRISTEENNRLETYLVGEYYDTSIPYSYLVEGELKLSGRQLKTKGSNNNGDLIKRNIQINELLPLPNLFIEYKLQQFQNNANTTFSDLGRMMNYMLTTVARMRIYNKHKFGPGYSHKNILNEGDVELSLNLALILEQALLFRAFDGDSIKEIDRYFYGADELGNPENPTGKRLWGSAEINNYYEYQSRRALVTNPTGRLLSTLVNQYVTTGRIDPTDLLALYLVLDKGSRTASIISPKDTWAILQERYGTSYLMDPRVLTDPSDTTNLKFILNLPSISEQQNSFHFSSELTGDSNYQRIEFLVDQQPNYLVLGADFKVTGLDNPRGWDTTASKREGTRTPFFVPEPPEEHDYRLEWDLEVKGKFNLKVKAQDEIPNGWLTGFWQEKEIDFGFPLNIYTWFEEDPKINSVNFVDFNTGQVMVEGWVITTESVLVEYFEKTFWKYLKPFVALGFDSICSILTIAISNQGLDYSFDEDQSYLDSLIMGDNGFAYNWLSDILLFQAESLKRELKDNLVNFLPRFEIFMEQYFLDYLNQYDEEFDFFNFSSEPQFPYPAFRPWLSELGFEVTLFYDAETNILEIKLHHPNGYLEILVDSYTSSKEQIVINLKNHLELPGILNLTTTVTSAEAPGEQSKPEIFVNGILFNKYTVSSQVYSKHKVQSGSTSANTESNEKFLVTRAKFGKLYPVITLKLPELSPGPVMQDVSVDITILIPEAQQALAPALRQKLAGLSSEVMADTSMDDDVELYLAEKLYLSKFFSELSEALYNWLKSSESFTKLALEFSISSPKVGAYLNVTVFLTEALSAENFVKWLAEFGSRFILALGNPNTLLTNLAYLLTYENRYLSISDLEQIDFELSNRKLNHDLLLNLGVGNTISDAYKFTDKEKQNLVLIVVLPGKAMIDLASGIIVDKGENDKSSSNEDQEKSNTFTYTQAYYCLQPKTNDTISTQVLLGANWLYRD
jgi:hypothetical protein